MKINLVAKSKGKRHIKDLGANGIIIIMVIIIININSLIIIIIIIIIKLLA